MMSFLKRKPKSGEISPTGAPPLAGKEKKIEQLKDVLFAPVGTSGSMMFWMVDKLLGTEGKLKSIAFISGIDKSFLCDKEGVVAPNDVVPITEFGTAGDIALAETYYNIKRNYILDILARKMPFRAVLVFCFAGGGTQRAAYLFIKDLLEEFSGPADFPKILALVKLPAHNSTPDMIRNTRELLKNLKELHKNYERQLSVAVFSDGVGLEQVEPRVKEMLIEKRIRWPDFSNAPAGDWVSAILSAFSESETNITDVFNEMTQPPLEGSYGPFSAPIIIRTRIERDLDTARRDLSSKIDALSSVIDATVLQDVKYKGKEQMAVYGALWAPPADPGSEQLDVITFPKALEEALKKLFGVKKPKAKLMPIRREGAMTIEILGLLRGIEFSFHDGDVDTEKL
jgi:hypothetical protein